MPQSLGWSRSELGYQRPASWQPEPSLLQRTGLPTSFLPPGCPSSPHPHGTGTRAAPLEFPMVRVTQNWGCLLGWDFGLGHDTTWATLAQLWDGFSKGVYYCWGIRAPGSSSLLWVWASSFPSWDLSFPICKMSPNIRPLEGLFPTDATLSHKGLGPTLELPLPSLHFYSSWRWVGQPQPSLSLWRTQL